MNLGKLKRMRKEESDKGIQLTDCQSEKEGEGERGRGREGERERERGGGER
jgi:hypothetical protein